MRARFSFPSMDHSGPQRTHATSTSWLPITLSPDDSITHHPARLLYFPFTGAHSSVGQSARFTSVRSQVQVLLRPPPPGYRLQAISDWL